MIELIKVQDRVYYFDRTQFVKELTGDKLDRCKEMLGPFVISWIVAPEKGTDGLMYETHQLGIQFQNDKDAVMFTVIVNG